MELSEDQLNAIKLGVSWWQSPEKVYKPFVITGAAGTGKSTILSSLLKQLEIPMEQTLFVATSATAVTNVHDKNPSAKASTIAGFIKSHSEYIEITQGEDVIEEWSSGDDVMMSKIKGLDVDELFSLSIITEDGIETADIMRLNTKLIGLGYTARRKQTFDIDNEKQMDAFISVVVIDELGMVSDTEMNAILAKGVPVIATGDPYQLPPINENKNQYIINPEYNWYFELTSLHRQAVNSGIVQVADVARHGGFWKQKASELAQLGYPDIIVAPHLKNSAEALSYADVILSTTNASVEYYNRLLHEYKFGHKAGISVGDKIVVTANSTNRDEQTGLPELSNGQFGVITKIYENDWLAEDDATLVDLDLDGKKFERIVINNLYMEDPRISAFKLKDVSADGLKLFRKRYTMVYRRKIEALDAYLNEVIYVAYGYAMTIHRAQGKEWNNVTFDTNVPTFMQEDTNALVYTALTRAKEKLLLI